MDELSSRRTEYNKDSEAFREKHPFLFSLLSNENLSEKDVLLLLVEIFQGGIDAVSTDHQNSL